MAVLRLSGPDALAVARGLCPEGPPWRPRRASLRRAVDEAGALIDELLVTWMPGPRSHTGEDLVELGCHGNPVLVEQLLDACVRLGARPARSGEFTRRALEHGRVDLVQAEAVAALVAAPSPAGVALARRASTELGPALAGLAEALLTLAAEVEVRLDHPGEDLGWEEDAALAAGLRQAAGTAAALAGTWRAGRVRLEGARVALVGPVNAGKSSLFNALLGQARALVSPLPGTTRDVVERALLVDGQELVLLDTAGERESEDPLEQAGVAMGRAMAEDVDLVVVVVPGHRPMDAIEAGLLARTEGRPRLWVATHADRVAAPRAWRGEEVAHRVSAVSGQGIDALRQRLGQEVLRGLADGEVAPVVSQRQHELLRAVAQHLEQAEAALVGLAGPAVAAEELTRALGRLGELSGQDVREEVLDRLFARFCIGK